MRKRRKLIIALVLLICGIVIARSCTYSELGGSITITDENGKTTDELKESDKLNGKATMKIDIKILKGQVNVKIVNEKNQTLWEKECLNGETYKEKVKIKNFKKLKIRLNSKDASGTINYTFRN